MSNRIKVLTGTYASGYAIQAPIYTLSIAAGGYVEGYGISDTRKTTTLPTVINSGRVFGSSVGVYLQYGGSLINGDTVANTASIVGKETGVIIVGGVAKVTNFGQISGDSAQGGAGVSLGFGGAVINGADSDVAARIKGYYGVQVFGGLAKVTNFGTIVATGRGGFGVAMDDGGVLANGDAGDHSALITGDYGVVVGGAAGTVTNFGTIAEHAYNHSEKAPAVQLNAGGVVTNGAVADIAARITGYFDAVDIGGAAGTVKNFATIVGSQTIGYHGVLMSQSGQLTNGATNDGAALIEAATGVSIGGVATVTNFGSIVGGAGYGGMGAYLQSGVLTNGGLQNTLALIIGNVGVEFAASATVRNFGYVICSSQGKGYGVYMKDGGMLTNGAASDTQALISSVKVTGATATIQNFGSIEGSVQRTRSGVYLSKGGSITNGSATDLSATIAGYFGVFVGGSPSTVQNFGTMLGEGYGRFGGRGAYLEGGDLTNGSTKDATALIQGYKGVVVYGSGETVTNFGTILGGSGTAVAFGYAGDTLVVEAGSVLIGGAAGDGGVLDLASGTGTIGSIAAGTVVVGVAPSTTTYTSFGTVEVGAGAKFTLSGSGAIGAGGTTTLDIDGTMVVTGVLTGAGTVSGAGTLAVAGGMAAFGNGSILTVAKVTLTAHAAVNVGSASLTFAGLWSQTGASTLSVAAGAAIDFTGAGNTFGGPLNGAGTIAFVGGSDTLTATHISGATTVQVGNAAVTLSGAIVLAGTITTGSPGLIVAVGGAALSGGGALDLAAPAVVKGAGAGAVLTNVDDQIFGGGQLGDADLSLINDAAGVITGDGLTIQTGTNTIANAGVIASGGGTGVTIASAVNNTGTLFAANGDLIVTGTVTGAGIVQIGAGRADFTRIFTENVTFTAPGGGTLELARSRAFTGQITGFSKTGTSTLELGDISFVNGTTKATYSGTVNAGVLTVTNGTNVARITLEGDYTTSSFTVSAAVDGGTAIVDPSPGGGQEANPFLPLHPFVAAMASLGGGAAGGLTAREADNSAGRTNLMARPHVMLA